MNELNPLFEAMNNIDDNIICNAQKKAKKPMLLHTGIIVAAAVAMLTLGVGFAVEVMGVFGTGKDNFIISGSGITIQFDLKYHEISIPEEFAMRCDGIDCYRPENMKPSELFAKFGVSPLLNDNFEEYAGNNDLEVELTEYKINFGYTVRDKNIGAEVRISASYDTVENMESQYSTTDNDVHPEVVTLNDKSQCVVTSSTATFAYDGVFYIVTNYGEEQSHNAVKQILTDLGVL